MRALIVLSLAAVSACASSTAGSTRPETESIRVGSAGKDNLRLTSITQANVTPMNFSLGKVWHALPAAFELMAIPITRVDTALYSISNDGMKLRRQLGTVSLSRFIDCGSTQIGDNADTYDVYLTIVSQVVEDKTSGLSSLQTTFEAMARPIAFSREYSRCSSRGVLEKRIADAVKAQLQ
jgi:hypothetical protein